MFVRQMYHGDGIRISKETMEIHNLTSVLAWAAKRRVSYQYALKSLVAQDIPLIFRMLIYVTTPLYHTSLIRRNKDGFKRWRVSGVKPFFRSAVENAVTDLDTGYSLSEVLKTHLRWWLPEYYIKSIELAEERNCLEETLLQLGQTTKKVNRRRKEIFSVMVYPFIILFIGFVILWGLMVFIIPKFRKIFDDLLGNSELPALTDFVVNCSQFIIPEHPLTLICILQIPWLVYYFFCTHRGDWLLLKIPFIRRSVLRWKMIDAIQALSVYTRMKMPVPEALSMVCDHQPSSILKKRLKKVRDDVGKGENLAKSWSRHFKNNNISNFYIQSASKLDKLPENLDQLAVILQDEDNRKHGMLMKVLEPLLLFIISFTVGVIVISMFLPMIEIVNMMSGWAE